MMVKDFHFFLLSVVGVYVGLPNELSMPNSFNKQSRCGLHTKTMLFWVLSAGTTIFLSGNIRISEDRFCVCIHMKLHNITACSIVDCKKYSKYQSKPCLIRTDIINTPTTLPNQWKCRW